MTSILEKLRELFPSCSREIDEIGRLRSVMDGISIDSFFEPVSRLNWSMSDKGEKKNVKLDSLEAGTLAAWAAHVSYGTRVRMREFEDSFLEQLLNHRFLTAMVISRAHMESAAVAVYAMNLVVSCAEKNNWEIMKVVIPRMLFGTSLMREPKLKPLQDMLGLSATEPIQIMDAIDAMDRFAESTGATLDTPRFRAYYAWFCEYAHPSMGSTGKFFNVIGESPDGWVLKYEYDEKVQDLDVKACLGMTLDNMRAGYANALMLSNCMFQDSPGGILYIPPPKELSPWIWNNIIHSPDKT